MRQARSVELVAQRRRMELFMHSQVRPHFAAWVFAIALPSRGTEKAQICAAYQSGSSKAEQCLFLLHNEMPFAPGLI